MRRREFVSGAIAAGAAMSVRTSAARAADEWVTALDFRVEGDGEGWAPGWLTTGVANLRRAGGLGLLEAASDVFPNDPRPVAFAVDRRVRDGAIRAVFARAGDGGGVVLRRAGPRDYYAAIFDGGGLSIVRRSGVDLAELARVAVQGAVLPVTLTLDAAGAHPTLLHATLADALGRTYVATARDFGLSVQAAGDPGILATANTLLPSGDAVMPALGNLHLLPYGTQEGATVLATPAGQAFLDAIGERSTAAVRRIELRSTERVQNTPATVLAATTGVPTAGGARLHVASDLPARVQIEIARRSDFRGSTRLPTITTDDFDAAIRTVRRQVPGERVYWRARLRRGSATTLGPTRSFRVLPGPGDNAPARIAFGACAAQFGPIFDHLAATDPDVFVWQGDLNYPDTQGPLAQSIGGYAGIWRDFLANPRLAPILGRSAFAAQRDDHDYATQDANASTIPARPWSTLPWDALVCDRLYYRFAAGTTEIWVLDQRRFKSDPQMSDTPAKSLLGEQQRQWLLRTLSESRAALKVICSPCTVFDSPANTRDGNWANGFSAERKIVLDHIAARVTGRTLFISGDTHVTMVYDRDGQFEARACPLDIPVPNDVSLADPGAVDRLRRTPGVAYSDERGHFSLIETHASATAAILDYSIVREDGARPFTKRFEVAL